MSRCSSSIAFPYLSLPSCELIPPAPPPFPLPPVAARLEMIECRRYRIGELRREREAEAEAVDHTHERVSGADPVPRGDPLAVTFERPLGHSHRTPRIGRSRSAILGSRRVRA